MAMTKTKARDDRDRLGTGDRLARDGLGTVSGRARDGLGKG